MANFLFLPSQLPVPFRAWPQTGQWPYEPRGRSIPLGSGPPAIRSSLVFLLLGWFGLPAFLGGVAAIGMRIARQGPLKALSGWLASPSSAVRFLFGLSLLALLLWVLVKGFTAALWQRRHNLALAAGKSSQFGIYLGETHLVAYAPVFRHAPRVVCVPRSQCLGAQLTRKATRHGAYYVPTVLVSSPSHPTGVRQISWPPQRFSLTDAELVDALHNWIEAGPVGGRS